MGQKNSLMPDSQLLGEELIKMKLLAKQNEYWVYEKPEMNKQFEYQVYKDENKDFMELENFAIEIKKQNFAGIAKIINIKRGINSEWFTKEYLFAVLIEHPKYTLQEYLQKKQAILQPNSIIQLLGQIVGAQKILGDSAQYLGLNDIFTNDGNDWLLKPFQQTTSFVNKMKMSIGIGITPDGYPAPEEYDKKKIDIQKVKVFNLGMIVLQLMLCSQEKKSIDLREIYKNDIFNKEILQSRIQSLTNKSFTKVFMDALKQMMEIDPTKRPSFPEVSLLLIKQESGIQIHLKQQISNIVEIKGSDKCNGQLQTFTNDELQQREYIASIEKNLLLSKKKLGEEQMKNEEKSVDFSEAGYVAGSKERVKKYDEKGRIKYEGEVKENQSNGYGILYFYDFIEITNPLNYIDLKDAMKSVTKYDGYFKEDKKHGQGKLYFSNGENFTGDFENDQINGTGKFEQTNKQIITGNWKNGVYQFASHQLKLQIQNNEIPIYLQTDPFTFSRESVNQPAFNFDGISQLAVDDSYLIGSKPQKVHQQIDSGQKSERLELQNGNYYMGQTLNSVMHGNGKIIGQGGQILYEGQFRQGEFDGYGTLYNLNQIENKSIIPKDLTKDHIGNSWTKYIGDFVNGKKQGSGRLFFCDNSEFCGEFKDDCISGQGTFSIKSAGLIYGEWKQGCLIRQLQQ